MDSIKMKKIQSNISPAGKCLSPVSAKCVTWDGPDIMCLDGTCLKNGQNVEVAMYNLASRLCLLFEAVDLTGINTCINSIPSGSSVTVDNSSSIKEVFSAIINKVCSIDGRIQTLEGTSCPEPIAVVPECLRALALQLFPATYNTVNYTLNLSDYANLVATEVCNILISITSLQNSVVNINQNIANLWNALNTCTNATTNLVQPTCTNNWTLNPTGNPQSIQVAYGWLEGDFCQLQSAVGNPSTITENIAKVCPGLGNADRLSSGGVMSALSGWVDNPTTLAESLGNLWLTVCDMRSAVSNILDTCCFSPCSYLEFGYDLIFDPDGAYVDIVFNLPFGNSPIIFHPNTAAFPSAVDYVADATVAPPSWVTTQFPTSGMSNVTIILDDGTGQTIIPSVPYDILDLATLSNGTNNGIRVVFATENPTYDKLSINQTINISFVYEVYDPVLLTTTSCGVNQLDGFVFECDNPPIYPYNVNIQSSQGTNLNVIVGGLYTPTLSIETGTATAGTNNTLTDSSKTWTVNDYTYPLVSDATANLIYITGGTGVGQVRVITANTATTITVDKNWDINPDNTSQYEIKDKYYDYPFASTSYFPTYIKNIVDMNFRVVSIDAQGYNPNDPNTWLVVAQGNNITPATACTTGWSYGANLNLTGNTNYGIAMQANYVCDSSEWSIVDYLMPIPLSVSVVAPGNVFTASNTNVENRLSNGTALTPTIQTVPINTSFGWPVRLPTPGNDTEFEVVPKVVSWAFQGITPFFCLCGITVNPDGQAPGGQPLRDTVLGSYRGYNVMLYSVNPTTFALSPVLDSNSDPYATNSIEDPTLSFPNNVGGSPILLSIPPTFSDISYPVRVVYDPSAYPVQISQDFHEVTMDGFNITLRNFTAAPLTRLVTVTLSIYNWDPNTQYSNLAGTSAYTNTVFLPARPGLPGTFSTTVIAVPSANLPATYGDKVICEIVIYREPVPGAVVTATGDMTITSLPGSPTLLGPFSCSGVSYTIGGNWPQPTGGYEILKYAGVVTEDYIIKPGNPTPIVGDFS